MAIRVKPAAFLSGFCLSMCLAHAGQIHDAARTGDAARVRELLASDPRLVGTRDGNGRTPLHLAAYRGHREVIEVLLASGADKGATDRLGRRPADVLSKQGDRSLFSLLLDRETTRLAEHVFRITLAYGQLSNVAAFIGPDGVLLVDTGYSEVAEVLGSVVRALGKEEPTYIINTHLHSDHVGGNSVLGGGATVIDYRNLGQHLAGGLLLPGKGPLKASSTHAFERYYSLHYNGEEVRLIPTPGAHSGADLLVHFVDSGVVHMGDLLIAHSFPSVRESARYMGILDTVVEVFPTDTRFISGHGPDCSMGDLKNYRTMLRDTIDVVTRHMKAGRSLEQMREGNVLKAWAAWGVTLPGLDADYWIQAIHASHEAELHHTP